MVLTRILSMSVSHLMGIVSAGEQLARGWGESIKWMELGDAVNESSVSQKPMMVIVHKSSCPVCKRVKPLFAAHAGIQHLSNYFVMVNLEPHEVPNVHEYSPDGAYVPRIMFFSPTGRICMDVYGNEPRFKYFYDDMNLLEANMRRVLRDHHIEI